MGTAKERVKLAKLLNRAVNLEEIGRMDRARKLLREAEEIIQQMVRRNGKPERVRS